MLIGIWFENIVKKSAVIKTKCIYDSMPTVFEDSNMQQTEMRP